MFFQVLVMIFKNFSYAAVEKKRKPLNWSGPSLGSLTDPSLKTLTKGNLSESFETRNCFLYD